MVQVQDTCQCDSSVYLSTKASERSQPETPNCSLKRLCHELTNMFVILESTVHSDNEFKLTSKASRDCRGRSAVRTVAFVVSSHDPERVLLSWNKPFNFKVP